MQIETGTFEIGNNNSLFKRVTIPFRRSFHRTPTLVANTLQGANFSGNIADTFAVSVKSVSRTEAVVQVQRVDSPGSARHWGQDLCLSWIAIA